MAKKLPHANNWKERKIEDWNANTFRAYLKDKHRAEKGLPYVSRSVQMEAGMIKRTYEEFGKEVTKRFIDKCFELYKPLNGKNSVNFAYMYSSMRSWVLPEVLEEMQREINDTEIKEESDVDDALDFL